MPAKSATRMSRRTGWFSRPRRIQLGIIVILVVAWQYAGTASRTLGASVSNPGAIVAWIWSWATGTAGLTTNGWVELGSTLETALFGYVLGVVAGVLLGSALAAFTPIRKFFGPFANAINAFPKVALAPLFIVVFGVSEEMKSYFVASGVMFISLFAVYDGLRSVDRNLVDRLRTLGASRAWKIRVLYVPAIAGWIIAGLRLTVAWSISYAVIVEFLSSGKGMGTVVESGNESGNIPQVFGGIAIVVIVALIIDRILIWLGHVLTPWRTE